MNKIVVEDDLSYIQNQYWIKMGQYKFDLLYYGFYIDKCVLIMRVLKSISIGLTTLCTACCMRWSDNQPLVMVCGIAIILCQVYNSISHLIPFDKRKSELKALSNELQMIYIEMERTWRQIASSKLSTYKSIDEKLHLYITSWEEKQRYYLKDDSLPCDIKVTNKATKEANLYLKNLSEGTYAEC